MVVNPYLLGLYTGVLAEPIAPLQTGATSMGLLGPRSDPADAEQQRREKLPALFDHFGIDPTGPDAWQSLTMALAEVHVPGFRLKLPEPQIAWPSTSLAELLALNKRKRGRPRIYKPGPAGAGLLGIGATPDASRAPGRPAERTMDEKREFVVQFAELKAAGGTDHDVARRIARSHFPGANSYSLESEVKAIVRKVKRWRGEVRKPPRNSADTAD